MRNLVVCCDGTWNTPDQKRDGILVPTNVFRLYNCVSDIDGDNNPQLKYYHPGVGTDGTWWERLIGGAIGVGLDKNIMSAYKWLGVNYQPGDKIFFFGYSRGAYTVRSVVGMISYCGLLDLAGLDDKEVWKRVERSYEQGYRKSKNVADWAKDWAFHGDAAGSPVPISFLGVWDTVGALGVPDDMTTLNFIDNKKWYDFHDTNLSNIVQHARHAVAIDERRASFTPTLWTNVEAKDDVKQVWFPGVHGDVGGGYLETGLSDGALKWMMDEVYDIDLGLIFKDALYKRVKPNYQDLMHFSDVGLFKYLRTQPRSVPRLTRDGSPTKVHDSVFARQDDPPIAQVPYRPTVLLEQGDSTQRSVFAAPHWNETGLYLEAGSEYEFDASGEWLDRTIKCGPAGTSDGKFHASEVVHLAGSLWGEIEDFVKILTKNEQANFYGTKRVEKLPWFALVGTIANGGNPNDDGTPEPHEIIPIGDGCRHTVKKSGYLYCFANDAWHFYDNNRGSVILNIKRLRK